MTSLRPTREPAFLWQAGLILLPVVIMAAVALRTIIQSRSEVEREARQRAEEVARQYGVGLERRLGAILLHHDTFSDMWSDYLAEVTGGWPGSKRRAQVEAEWHLPPDPPYPGWRAEEVFPDRFGFTTGGQFLGPESSLPGLEFNPAPQPPAWVLSLTPDQREAWQALKTACLGTNLDEIEQRRVEFEQTGPGTAAKLNAAFLGLRARLTTLPPAEAVTEALRFAREGAMLGTWRFKEDGSLQSVSQQMPSPREQWGTLSEAGLPLVNLAFAEALRYARQTGPSEELWSAIPGQVLRAPSPLVPALLDQLQEIGGTNAALQDGVGAWRTLWNARLKLYAFAGTVRQTANLRGLTTTNFWVEHDQTRWLCILNPEPSALLSTVTQPTNGLWTSVRFLPKPVVEWMLVRALDTFDTRLPAYLGLAASLEGEPLALPQNWSARRATNSAPVLLAQAGGALSWTPKLQVRDGPAVDYEMLPSRPRFTLQVYLADPALLYAAYRRHALLLAGLVAAAAFGALIGVLASWRAFRRQLRLNELKSNFVSSVSHELRAPIASVRLMAESLERGKVADAPKQQEYFRFIVQECRRLSALIENVLDFSRIEQGRKQYDFEPTDLLALTQQTVKLMETYAAERGVHLQLQLPDPQPSTPNPQPSADGKALQQALVNLIDNALKHSPKAGTVTVGLEIQSPESNVQSLAPEHAPGITHHVSRITHPASRILLWVSDHGPGIPPAEHEKIFERFYRCGSELRRQTQGVGIGLSIVKHIVEAHGGRVLVRSAAGQGSRFTIELPLNRNQQTKPQSPER